MLLHLISVHSPDLLFLSEPKASLDSSNPVLSSGYISSFSNTNSSLWCFCKPSSTFCFSLLDHSSQHISINAVGSSPSSSSLITGVYGSTDYRVRRVLWDYLISTSSTINPWCVIGDFNAILLGKEKLSTRPPSSLSVKDFNDMVLASDLQDLGFRGSSFIWANNRQGQAFVAARLDRAFSNVSWLDSFEDPMEHHLPRIASDHSPILLSHNKSSALKNIPLKFEAVWLSHASFSKVVEDSWAIPCSGTPQFILAQKLKNLKFHLKVWNKEVFGRLKVNISGAEHKVMDLQTAFDNNPCDPILLDLNSAKSDLHNWLKAESDHWKQRAKISWLQDGDRNTTFFHLSAKSRGISNRIDNISEGGTIFEEEEQIRDEATKFFSIFLKSSPSHINEGLFEMVGPSVSTDQNKTLIAIPSPQEIKEAVFQLKKNSSGSRWLLRGLLYFLFADSWS